MVSSFQFESKSTSLAWRNAFETSLTQLTPLGLQHPALLKGFTSVAGASPASGGSILCGSDPDIRNIDASIDICLPWPRKLAWHSTCRGCCDTRAQCVPTKVLQDFCRSRVSKNKNDAGFMNNFQTLVQVLKLEPRKLCRPMMLCQHPPCIQRRWCICCGQIAAQLRRYTCVREEAQFHIDVISSTAADQFHETFSESATS